MVKLTFALLEGLHGQEVKTMRDLDQNFSTNLPRELAAEKLDAYLLSLLNELLQVKDQVII